MNTHLPLHRAIVLGAALIAMTWLARSLMPIAAAQTPEAVPVFEVDAAWPKPLPNNWAVGPVSGIATDARDHIWIIHRGEAVKQAGVTPAPPVIEFDAAGNVVQTWGGAGAGYDWPQQVHGITVRRKGSCLDQRQRREGHAHTRVHAPGEIPSADWACRREQRQQRHGERRPRDADARRSPEK